MLAGTVHACEGLLVKQAYKTVLCGNLLHDFHRQLVVIGCDVRRRINRSKLMLCGSNFVVLRLREDSELPELFVQILHVSLHAGLDDTEVMVVEFLSFRGLGTEESTAGEAKVGTLLVHLSCN